MKNRVALAKNNGRLTEAIRLALGQVGLLERVASSTRVALKPNFTYPYYKTGVTTSPLVIRETVKLLREYTDQIAIVETDGGYGAWQVQEAFAGHGIYQLKKEFGIEVGGYKVLDGLRLEKGYRYFTADVTPLENPYEAGLGFCVDLDKGEYIGCEALLKTKSQGIKRKLCTLLLDGDEYITIYGGEAIYISGNVISRVRSGGYGYTLKRNIAYAYLSPEFSKVGTSLEIEIFDKTVRAEVVQTVLYDPKGEKLHM